MQRRSIRSDQFFSLREVPNRRESGEWLLASALSSPEVVDQRDVATVSYPMKLAQVVRLIEAAASTDH